MSISSNEIKIILFTRYSEKGASSRVRSYQYLPYLKNRGVSVIIVPLLGDNYLKAIYSGKRIPYVSVAKCFLKRINHLINVRKFDLVWVEKEIFPWLPSIAESYLNVIRVPYIVDYDDAIFHKYDSNKSLLIRIVLKGKIESVMKRATVVIVGNEYLANRARTTGAKSVKLIPSVVNVQHYNGTDNSRVDYFTIGYICTPKTVNYLSIVISSLKKLNSIYNNIRLLLIGSGPYKANNIETVVREWSMETEADYIHEFDVGIMPLPDEQWERGKCGYKLIQYMACGKPVIASPVGINKKIVENGVNGFLVSSEFEWTNAFEALIRNQDLAKRMGYAGLKKVQGWYSLEITAPILYDIIKRSAKGR